MTELFTREHLPRTSPRDILTRGIAAHETPKELYDNPWIRTLYREAPGGSTAYGPLQITGSTLDDLTDKRITARGQAKLSDKEKNLIKKLKSQAELFRKHGNEQDMEGYDPRYDYGGEGDPLTSEEKDTYWDLGDRLFRLKSFYKGHDPDRLDDLQLAEVIGDWYGSKDKKKNEEYTAKVFKKLKKYTGGMIQRNPYPYSPRPI